MSNELIIKERVGGYRRDRDQDSDDSTSLDFIQPFNIIGLHPTTFLDAVA